MKKALTVCALFLILLLFALRIYGINHEMGLGETLEYSMNEVVPLENDFNHNSEEAAPGYSVQVLGCEWMEVSDFIEKYQVNSDLVSDSTSYYILVTLSCKNADNQQGTDAGISLFGFPLVGINYLTEFDESSFLALNPNMPGEQFALYPGTDMEMTLAYPINVMNKTEFQKLLRSKIWLNLTEYPNRKIVRLEIS
ncbi:MAG: DUF5028 domain-containing protein [Lachnospiraceae bacterium]|jgi:hypothetical protein|nr:DUF5028 domain-containing protein [Lachnospiraceae bacterium]